MGVFMIEDKIFKLLFCAVSISLLTLSANAESPDIELAWATEDLMNPESVVYHPTSNSLYVSNVNGSPTEKDGNGFISRVSLDGELLELEWLAGLDAPKGLALYGNKLYVADIDTLIEIDIPNARIVQRYKVDDAKFLNDVTSAVDGSIYVSDMVMNRIHRLRGSDFTIWLEDEGLLNPNGLLAEADYLTVGAWGKMTDGFATEVPGHMLRVSFNDMSISFLGDGSPIGNLDGVESDFRGGYYVTDWMVGKLYHINNMGNVELLLALEQGMADHEVILNKQLILLPMMNSNKLLAYRIIK
jgi:DNA-binding beta-propeller fold protein YncE